MTFLGKPPGTSIIGNPFNTLKQIVYISSSSDRDLLQHSGSFLIFGSPPLATLTFPGAISSANFSKLTGSAAASITLTAGTSLTGGGDLSANRTFAVSASGIGFTQLATVTKNGMDVTGIASSKTGSYSCINTDTFIPIDTTAGSITIKLPDPTTGARMVTYKKTTTDANPVSASQFASETIEGTAATFVCPGSTSALKLSWTFISNATNWRVI